MHSIIPKINSCHVLSSLIPSLVLFEDAGFPLALKLPLIVWSSLNNSNLTLTPLVMCLDNIDILNLVVDIYIMNPIFLLVLPLNRLILSDLWQSVYRMRVLQKICLPVTSVTSDFPICYISTLSFD